MEYLQVTFRLDVSQEDAAQLVDSILLEQSVETPAEVAMRNDFVRDNMMGSIHQIEPQEDGTMLATLHLSTITASVDVGQFLNVLFGNVSLHEHVRLEGFQLPDSLLDRFPGPRFGISGMRERLGVYGRPLTCSALKPVGLPLRDLLKTCEAFARGGIDLIKDDHYLADHSFSPFQERVVGCQEVIARVADDTGRRVGYCPNLSGTPDDIRRQLAFAQQHEVAAVMVAPMIMGLPAFYEMVRSELEIPVMVHPSFAGSTRMHPAVLLGQLLRLYGADAVIFANYGGRFSYSRDVCLDIAERLRAPWRHLRPVFPVPAGGMAVERTPELVSSFGTDAMLLVGGSLLVAGDALLERTSAFTESVATSALTNRTGDTPASSIRL